MQEWWLMLMLCMPQHSKGWWLGAVLSTAIPVLYSFSGGMRASLMTDATQARPNNRLLCLSLHVAGHVLANTTQEYLAGQRTVSSLM